MNKNVVGSRPPSGFPEGSIVRVKGPGHNISKTQGEDMGTQGHCVSGQVISEGLCETAEMTVFKFGFHYGNSVLCVTRAHYHCLTNAAQYDSLLGL